MSLSNIIRSKIEARFGKPIRYSKDCEALARSIEKNGHGRISVTTLKRMLGFAKDIEKPRLYTLDVLAAYIGYTDWSSLIAETGKPVIATPAEKGPGIINQGEDPYLLQHFLVQVYATGTMEFTKIHGLCRRFGKSAMITPFIIELVVHAGRTRNLQFLKKLFSLPHVFNPAYHEQGQLYYIGQTIGLLLRNDPGLADELIDTYAADPVAHELVVEWFVDEDYLSGYYGRLLDAYHKYRNKTKQDKIFYYALKYAQCMQTGDGPGEQQYYQQLLKIRPGLNLHPIPAGRYAGVCIAEERGFSKKSLYYATCVHYLDLPRYEDAIHFLLYLCRYLFRKRRADWISILTALFEEITLQKPGREKTHWGTKTENCLLIYLAYGKYVDGQVKKAKEYIRKADPNLFEAFMYKQLHTDYMSIYAMIR